MVPIPAVIYNQITFPLQILASKFAEWALDVMNIPVMREGNILDVAGHRLSVIEACSGIRSLLTLTFLSLVYGYFFEKHLWVRAALFLSVIPVAILANGSRVTITGVLTMVKPELAEGFFHEATGHVSLHGGFRHLDSGAPFLRQHRKKDRSQEGSRMNFLNARYAKIVTAFLLVQVFAFYAIASRAEKVPTVGRLSMFPVSLPGWTAVKEFPIEQETLDVLRADDTLDRLYVEQGNRRGVILFIAYFATQRYGQSPHSPKNCLPGAGWEPVAGMSSRPALQVPGEAQPIVINKYVTEHGDERSVTLYWYQSHGRVVADEFAAKFWSIADSLRYRRSDTSIVKITIDVKDGDVETATRTGYDFTRIVFPALLHQLPN